MSLDCKVCLLSMETEFESFHLLEQEVAVMFHMIK